MVTSLVLSDRLKDYINGKFSLNQLVDWCENAVLSDNFENENVLEIVSRIGLADVKEFGITWEDLTDYIYKIGFKINLELEPA